MNKNFVESISNGAPYFIIFLVFVITVSAIISLILVDVITGQIFADYVTRDGKFGAFISLAGTGMLIASGAFIKNQWDKENYWSVAIVGVIFLALQLADMSFDGMSVDIKRFGYLVSVSTLSDAERIPHTVFRFFVAGISFVGEPLGIGSLVAFPMMKGWLLGILKQAETNKKPSFYKSQNQPGYPTKSTQYPPKMPTYRKPQFPNQINNTEDFFNQMRNK